MRGYYKKIRTVILILISILTIGISFFSSTNLPQPTYAATDGKWYFTDTDTGTVGMGRSIYCIATDDCKIAYYDATNEALKFIDCNNASCTDATITILDGMTGCAITGCSTTADAGQDVSIYCIATDDCKLAYFDDTGNDLMFIDCDNSACTSGTRTLLDGGASCSLTNCSTSISRGADNSIFCSSSTDCKIVYSGGTAGKGVRFADCDDATCSTGTSTLIDLGSGCTATGCSTFSINSSGHSIYCVAGDDCKISYFVSSTNKDLKFVDCSNATCSTGQVRLLDGGAGCVLTNCSTTENRGKDSSIFCPTTGDCKIAYSAFTNSHVRFADCDDATCSSGTSTLIDGGAGCTLTGCGTVNRGNPSLYCSSGTDCKITYQDWASYSLRMADCDDATCSTGTATTIDGTATCTLDNCLESNVTEYRSSIFCLSSTDCKISYYEIAGTNIWMADCDDATCSTGTTATLDGHFLTQTIGSIANYSNYFGEYLTGKNTKFTMVSSDKYPSGTDTLGSGSYTLHLQLSNNMSSDTLDWEYAIGYCTISDNCTTKTPVVTSSTQAYDDSSFGPDDILAVAASNLTIPGPDNTKRIYVEMTITGGTGSLPWFGPDVNGTGGAFADTYIEVPVASVSTPTPTPTPTPTSVPTSDSSSPGGSGGDSPSSGVCEEIAPSLAPILFQAESVSTSVSSVTLQFSPAGEHYTRHRIMYGTDKNASDHEAVLMRTGTNREIIEYTVHNLKNNTRYNFKVRGENECSLGGFSNILGIKSPKKNAQDSKIVNKPGLERKAKAALIPTEISQVSFSYNVKLQQGAITWKTNHNATSTSLFGITAEPNETLSETAKIKNHRLIIENLDITDYFYYRAESTGNTIAISPWYRYDIKTDTSQLYDPAQDETGEDSNGGIILPPIIGPIIEPIIEIIAPIFEAVNESIVQTATGGLSIIISSLPGITNTPEEVSEEIITFSENIQKIPAVKMATSTLAAGTLASSALYIAPIAIRNTTATTLQLLPRIGIWLTRLVFFMPFVTKRKKERNWGIVYDSITKQPIDPAVVTLTNTATGEKKEKITDMLGRFGFLVNKGTYMLNVVKSDYLFPSKILKGKSSDGERIQLYFGKKLSFKDNDLVHVDIPLDPISFNWNQANKPVKYHPFLVLFKNQTARLITFAFLVLLIISYIISPTPLNLFMISLMIFFTIVNNITMKGKQWGTVFKKSGIVMPMIKIKAIRIVDNHELEGSETVTDIKGRYYLILEPGKYKLKAEHEENGKVKTILETKPIKIHKWNSVVSRDLKI